VSLILWLYSRSKIKIQDISNLIKLDVWCISFVPPLFSKSTKEVFNVQRMWNSLNMLTTMVNGQTFYIITWQSQWEGSPYFPPGDTLRALELLAFICSSKCSSCHNVLIWIKQICHKPKLVDNAPTLKLKHLCEVIYDFVIQF